MKRKELGENKEQRDEDGQRKFQRNKIGNICWGVTVSFITLRLPVSKQKFKSAISKVHVPKWLIWYHEVYYVRLFLLRDLKIEFLS